MLQYDWEESPGYWISTTLHALRRALNAELASQGITLRQWEVLACIAMEGELSQAELARTIEQDSRPPFAVQRARPLCTWPLVPRSQGGSGTQADNFVCLP